MTTTLKALITILVISALGAAIYFTYPYIQTYFEKPSSSVVLTTTTPSITEMAAATSTPTPTSTTITPVSDPGITWFSEPKKLDDLGLVKSSNDETYKTTTTYYRVANLESGGEIILAVYEFSEPGSPGYFRFKKDQDGKYSLLQNHSDSSFDFNQILDDKVLTDATTKYQSLSAPDFLTVGKTVITSAFGQGLFKDLANPKEVGETEYGKIYEIFQKALDKNIGGLQGRIIYIRLADSTAKSYTLKFNFLTDDEVALVTWNDGTKNNDKYTPESYTACATSASNNVITDTNNLSQRLIEAGKTNAGDKIYTVASDDEVVKAAYENYKIGREKDILTISEFAAQKPIFIWEDGFGDHVVFTGRDFAGLAECGKPVIYLYPEKETRVSVKVGAEITKSEPLYENGWTDVLARPDGNLTYQGQNYPYLFWEGKGLGNYPVIDSGFVVKKENIESTLKDHLSKLGLNQKESADFLEFWLPKMPNTPYARLTWFGTRQMNGLASLTISPKPDTMIRIFLDFAGLEKSVNIKPQNLSAPVRNGFTAVEWGGLLRGDQ